MSDRTEEEEHGGKKGHPQGAPKTSQEAARRAWSDPLHPNLPPRCPRCGERDPEVRTEGDAPNVDDPPACPSCGVDPRSMDAGRLLVFRGGRFKEFFLGFSYGFRGLLRLLRTPALWSYAKLPLLVNVALGVGALILSSLVVVPWLTGKPFASMTEQSALWYPLKWAASPPGWLIESHPRVLWFLSTTWLLVAFPFGALARLGLAPHVEGLSQAVERGVLELDPVEKDVFQRSAGTTALYVKDTLLLLLLGGVTYLLSVPLGMLPLLGWIGWFLLAPILWSGLENAQITLIRHGYGTRERARLYRTYRARFLGFGLAFVLLVSVPVLNLILLPAGVVGGVLLFLELERK